MAALETRFFSEELLHQGLWRVVYLNKAWQLAKRLLLPQKEEEMEKYTAWAGSTEPEAAVQWLETPIKVFYYGNPKYPPKAWMTYGSLPCTYSAHTILLQWTNRNHYDVVTRLA